MLSLPFLTAAPLPTSVPSEVIEERIATLLGAMSRADKIGQLQQSPPWEGDRGTLEDQIRAGRIGSILNESDPEAMRAYQRIAVEESPHGIPLIFARDVIHGFRTMAPIPLGLSATWNPELVEAVCHLSAKEARSTGLHWTFAPMIDVTRDPRWGRVAESPGEDAFLASVMGVAMVRGFQGDDLSAPDRLAACAKHFAAYGAAVGGRDYNTTWVPHQQLWEVYLPPFEAVVEAGVATFMTAFNDLNGVPSSADAFLFDEVLRQRWGFEGMVVSDWAAVEQLIPHGIAADGREAALLAARAGVDMEMTSHAIPDYLDELIEAGLVSEETLDRMVANILRVKLALGVFENPYPPADAVYPVPLTEEGLASARQAAAESAVLLKNEGGVLPLADGTRVAVIGPLADAPADQIGTWAFDGLPEDSVTPRTTFAELDAAGRLEVTFAPGLTYSRDRSTDGFAEAIAAAEAADVVLFFGGEEAILSGEAHSRAYLNLPGAQEALIEALAATGKPIVLVVLAGRPLVLEKVLPHLDGLLYAWHPGTMAGPGLADVLLGDVDASGRLPITFPKAEGQIPVFHGHRNTGRPFNPETWTHIDDIPQGAFQTSLGNESHYLDLGHEPRYWFGEGLSYTTFSFSPVTLSSETLAQGEAVEVTTTITNTGDRAGVAVPQLYFRDPAASLTRPLTELRGFERVALAPGESREVRFTLTPKDLAFPGPDGVLRYEGGLIEVHLGTSARQTETVDLQVLAPDTTVSQR